MKKIIIWAVSFVIFIFCLRLFLLAFHSWYNQTFWKWSYVVCDIWVWDPIRWRVASEDKERIYIKWERQCLMYCKNAPYWDEDQLNEMWITEEYKERYPDDDVKYKSECYRSWNDEDKMKAIINRYWRDD